MTVFAKVGVAGKQTEKQVGREAGSRKNAANPREARRNVFRPVRRKGGSCPEEWRKGPEASARPETSGGHAEMAGGGSGQAGASSPGNA